MKFLKTGVVAILDVVMSPFTILCALWMKVVARAGMNITPFSEKIFMAAGVLPIADHYYQPLIKPKAHLKVTLRQDRNLPGIDFNVKTQLEVLESFHFRQELLAYPIESKNDPLLFHYNNGSFASGDAEYLYSAIRHFKPSRIVEIGSGHSTLIAIEAIKKNKADDPGYSSDHTCIEPYEQPWLERTSAKIIRKKVEDIDINFFQSLTKNDILFIDSSHIIRPQGDVLFEFQNILPMLNAGVLVHVHDIFTPKDYLDSWVFKDHKLWNEQYLLEAFLTLNPHYEIIGALNFLLHHHRELVESKFPILAQQKYREPGSFWMRRK